MARLLRNTLESMDTPCSVKAYGGVAHQPRAFSSRVLKFNL
jgi:hypothetical protein